MKLLPNDTGKIEFETSCRRLANGAMTLAQSPEGATHGGCVIKS